MYKNAIKKLLCGTLCMTMLISMVMYNNTLTVDAKTLEANEDLVLNLEQVEETVVIDDENAIEKFMDYYNLDDSEVVEKIIYVPIAENGSIINEMNVNSRASSKYYINKIGSFEGAGALLASSWYVAPGGTMTVSRTLSMGYEFANISQIEGGIEELKAVIGSSYGYNLNASVSVSDSQNVEVATGCKKNVKAYVWEKTYRYEMWKNGLLNDTKIGSGTWDYPLGVVFIVGQNISLG